MTRGIHRSQPDLGLFARREPFAPGKRSFLLVSCLCIALVLSGCSFGKPEGSTRRGKAPAPATAISGAQRVSSISAAPSPMDTFRALAKPQGMRFTTLFAEPIGDTDARLNRVEDAVQSLRNDFDTVVPSMVRLVAIEKDMKELVTQLQSLTGGPAPAPVDEVVQEEIPIPGEDVAEGTEPAEAIVKADAGTAAPTSPVTPEAAPQGMPPEGAASPISTGASGTVAVEAAPQAAEPVAEVKAAPETSVNWSAPYGTKSTVPAPGPAPAAQELVAPINITPQPSSPAATSNTAAAQPSSVPAPVPAQESKAEVLAVRIADHPDKTRIVLDVTAQTSLKAEMSSDGKKLIVDVAGLGWKEKTGWLADSGVLAAGWSYANGKLTIDLIYPSSLKAQQVLPPNGTPYYRFVLDVFSKDVHR